MENIFWNPFCKIPIHLPAMSTAAKMLFSKWTTGAVKVMVRLGVDLTKFAEFAIEVFIWVVKMSWMTVETYIAL